MEETVDERGGEGAVVQHPPPLGRLLSEVMIVAFFSYRVAMTPARGPRATRPWTEAPTRPARTGEASASGSAGAVSSAGSSWRRASSRSTRARTVARTCATSSSLGGGVG